MKTESSKAELNRLKAAAQTYLLAIPIRPDVDTRKSLIQYYYEEEDCTRRVKIVIPNDGDSNKSQDYDWDSAAEIAWREKYGVEMPRTVTCGWAECTSASFEPYDGTKTLTDDSKKAIEAACASSSFTLDMLWLIVEGCNWTPGKPVAEDDQGWIAIWAQAMEEDFTSYIIIVRDVMGMPELPPEVLNENWVPEVLQKYAASLPSKEA